MSSNNPVPDTLPLLWVWTALPAEYEAVTSETFRVAVSHNRLREGEYAIRTADGWLSISEALARGVIRKRDSRCRLCGRRSSGGPA